jgi:hypothetical protein
MRHGSEAAVVCREPDALAVAGDDDSVDVLRIGVDPIAADEARPVRRRQLGTRLLERDDLRVSGQVLDHATGG